jgi:hypothetical protein
MFNFEVCAYLPKVKSKIPDFEFVDKSRSSGTQRLGKRGRFEIASIVWIDRFIADKSWKIYFLHENNDAPIEGVPLC